MKIIKRTILTYTILKVFKKYVGGLVKDRANDFTENTDYMVINKNVKREIGATIKTAYSKIYLFLWSLQGRYTLIVTNAFYVYLKEIALYW